MSEQFPSENCAYQTLERSVSSCTKLKVKSQAPCVMRMRNFALGAAAAEVIIIAHPPPYPRYDDTPYFAFLLPCVLKNGF